MPDLEWNRFTWNEGYPWQKDGDEWSVAWGGAHAHWYGSIYPRVNRFLPAHRILEIAPGRGRWSQFLLKYCVEYFGVDLSEACVQSCRRRFAAESRARFIVNDGQSLAMIPDNSIDFVFSYDSLVHVELDVIREYIWQIAQKLTPTGVAYLHHSNAASNDVNAEQARLHNRAQTVSAVSVKELIEDCSGRPLIQEEVNWGGVGETRIDCMTTFCRAGVFSHCPYTLLKNDSYITEAQLVRKYHSPYDLI